MELAVSSLPAPTSPGPPFSDLVGTFTNTISVQKQLYPEYASDCLAAIQIIADHRHSHGLKDWIAQNCLPGFEKPEMDIGEAYQTLEISDRTTDDDTILATYDIRVSDTPGRQEDYRRALSSIAKANNSQKLRSFLDKGFVDDTFTSAQASNDWPVGLENIGNTCYLNSLLQFYFTVTPLRHVVLNFDDYKMEVTEENLKQKRVGSRQVKGDEVRRAQKCTRHLSIIHIHD
jgi:ubiquitin carboxyl-terminal hydrolase 25